MKIRFTKTPAFEFENKAYVVKSQKLNSFSEIDEIIDIKILKGFTNCFIFSINQDEFEHQDPLLIIRWVFVKSNPEIILGEKMKKIEEILRS